MGAELQPRWTERQKTCWVLPPQRLGVLLEAASALAHGLAHVQLVVFIDGLLFN